MDKHVSVGWMIYLLWHWQLKIDATPVAAKVLVRDLVTVPRAYEVGDTKE